MIQKIREQKLIDICFEIGLMISEPKYGFTHMSNESKATWIADQLRGSGFDTEPMGASWGVLRHGRRHEVPN